MKLLLKQIFLCLITLCVFACGRNTNSFLDEIESILYQFPDSAYVALNSYDRSILQTGQDTARFALLYFLSFDMLYSDIPEDTMINEAVKFYGRENSNNAFMAWYYQGRCYEKANKYGHALRSYITAELIPSRKVDSLFLSKLHFAKSRIYSVFLRDKEAVDEASKASIFSLKADDIENYAGIVLEQARLYCGLNPYGFSDFAKADSCLIIVRSLWPQISLSRQCSWYDTMISFFSAQGETEPLKTIIEEYKEYMDQFPEMVDWKTLAVAYNELGEIPLMKESLEKCIYYGQNEDGDAGLYHLLLAEAEASMEDYDSAYHDLFQYCCLLQKQSYFISQHDIPFLEERYTYAHSHAKEHNIVLAMIIILAISFHVVRILSNYLKENKRKSEEYRKVLFELKEEYDSLIAMQIKNDEIGSKALSILNERMLTLKAFLTKDDKAVMELNRLSGDRTAVLESIGMIYAIYAPKFIEVLISKGLSPAEIGYCCLHIMGYSTKEAGQFICYSGYYNVSSRIRSKLQIDMNASTLSKWLNQLYSEMRST